MRDKGNIEETGLMPMLIIVGHLGGNSYLFLRCVTQIAWMPQC